MLKKILSADYATPTFLTASVKDGLVVKECMIGNAMKDLIAGLLVVSPRQRFNISDAA